MQPRKKYQVFISSTYEDLREERNELVRSCLKIGHIPIGMEMFSAASAEQWEVIKRTIDGCDYYALIVAQRYGSVVEAEDGISYTEKEYDYAVAKGVPVLGLMLDPSSPWPQDRLEPDEHKRRKLEDFRLKVKSRMIAHWKNKDELGKEFIAALSAAIESHPRTGWLPANMAADPTVSNELARLSEENSQLRSLVEGANPEDAQLAQLAGRLSQIPSQALRDTGGDTSLLALFRLTIPLLAVHTSFSRDINGTFQRQFMNLGRVPNDAELLKDLWALEAHRVLVAGDQVRPDETYFKASPRGIELLRHEERERMSRANGK